MNKTYLSPKEVAEAIGASEASIKRWCDRGLIQAEKTSGGHRRLPVSSVIEFLRKGYKNQGLVRPEILGLPSGLQIKGVALDEAAIRSSEYLKNGKEVQFRNLLLDLYISGSRLVDICEQLLVPQMHDVGVEWHKGELEIYEERRSCEIMNHTLHEISNLSKEPKQSAPLAIGGTLPGDHYTLPSAMVETVLREQGWRAEFLGTDLPLATLVAAIEKMKPRIFWLSVSAVRSEHSLIEDTKRLFEVCQRNGAAFVLGGRAVEKDLRRELSFSVFCDNLYQVVSFGETLHSYRRTTH